MAGSAQWHVFEAAPDLAKALAGEVAARLDEAVAERGTATLAVSGGTTPAPFFRTLAKLPLPWDRITVLPVDERFVPPSSDRSNEKLIRDNLLQGEAARANFIGLWSKAPSVEAAAQAADAALSGLSLPLDIVVLGMGGDGHTASFFPDSPQLGAVIDPAAIRNVLWATAPSAGEPRLTLTLPPIVSARMVILHIEGMEKRTVLEDALAKADPHIHPISAVLNQAPHPVEIYWAPKKDEKP